MCSEFARRNQFIPTRIYHKLEAIKKSGEPLTLVELDRFYREPAPEDDAAPLLEESFSRIKLNESDTTLLASSGKNQLSELRRPLPDAKRKSLARILSDNQQALE